MSILMGLFALGGAGMAGVGAVTGLSFIKDSCKEVDEKLKEVEKQTRKDIYYTKINENAKIGKQYNINIVEEALKNNNKDKKINEYDYKRIKEAKEKYDTKEERKREYSRNKAEENVYEMIKKTTNPITLTCWSVKKAFETAIEIERLDEEGFFDD